MIALGIGLVSGFLAGVAGVGGGIVIVPAAVLLLGFTQHEVQGTSLLAIILTAIAATIINRKNRRGPDRGTQSMVGAGGVVGAVLASVVALGVDGRVLSSLFGVFAVLVAARTLYQEYDVGASARLADGHSMVSHLVDGSLPVPGLQTTDALASGITDVS